jgi:hypothetical protein
MNAANFGLSMVFSQASNGVTVHGISIPDIPILEFQFELCPSPTLHYTAADAD